MMAINAILGLPVPFWGPCYLNQDKAVLNIPQSGVKKNIQIAAALTHFSPF